MTPRVLITACGAKVALVRAFREAVVERGGQVLAADASPLSAALHEAHQALPLPPWTDPGYGTALLELCRRHGVTLLVPTSDRELALLAERADALRAAGTAVLLPAPETLARCRDKAAFVAFCRDRGFPVPHTWPDRAEPSCWPVFVRPVQGQGGLGCGRVGSPALLAALRQEYGTLLVQEAITDPEYSVDLLMDLAGRPLQAVARRRLVVLGGEAQVSRVERLDILTGAALALGEALGLVGHNVMQAFYSPAAGPRFIEVNPRFGGASSLSIQAGLDSPRRLLALLAEEDEARRPRPIRHGLTLLRHGEDRFQMPEDSPWPEA